MMLLAVATAAALLARMEAVNSGLRSCTATIHAHVTMRSFPFLAADLGGTYYFKAPDKNKVEFSSGVPVVAAQFDKLYAHVEPPSQWSALYKVTPVSDDGKSADFRLVPRKAGNIEHIDATVDDTTATVTTMRWNYVNGGYAEVTNQYRRVDGNFVVESQTGRVDEPGYVADVSSTLEDYKINPPISDSIFVNQ